MNVGRAFTYAFDDPDATGKLVIAAALGFIGTITLPLLLVGLVAWTALLGYLVELVRNLQDRRPRPLPRWDNYGAKINRGGSVLVAGLVYNLPNIVCGCCVGSFLTLWRDSALTSGLTLFSLCCLLPLLMIYNLLTWPMLALGLARYADENNAVAFFQFGDLFSTISRRPGLTAQWLLVMLAVSLLFGLLFLVPCIGWAAVPALSIPVVGYLAAGFARLADQPGR